MNREEIIALLRAHEVALRKRRVLHTALFGSVARGEAKEGSDIDILIELEPEAPVGLFEYVGITQYLADLFRARVDVANRSRLKALVRQFTTGLTAETFAADLGTFYAVTRTPDKFLRHVVRDSRSRSQVVAAPRPCVLRNQIVSRKKLARAGQLEHSIEGSWSGGGGLEAQQFTGVRVQDSRPVLEPSRTVMRLCPEP